MSFSGRLEGIAPSDIFQVISQNRMTGTLIARCPDRTAMVVFKDGQVMEATSDAPGESLGHLLVAQGLVTEAVIDAARNRLKQEPDRSLGPILVQMGAISEKTLEAVVFRQIGHIVHRLMSCDDGFITFDRGEIAVKRKLNTREFFLPAGVSPEYLIMERARVVDEERRHRPDRRAHARDPLPGGEQSQEAYRPVIASDRSRSAATVERLASWFRGIRLPKMDGLRNTVGSVVGKAKQLAKASGDPFRRMAGPRFESALGKVRAWSPDGKAMMVAGIAVTALGIVLILLFTLSKQSLRGDLVITGKVVKLRASPTTNAKVVIKIPQGETVSPIEFKDGWHQVRTKAGETGWVWKNLVQQREEKKGRTFSYRVTGFELLLVAGLALLFVGIMRKRRVAATPPRILRAVK